MQNLIHTPSHPVLTQQSEKYMIFDLSASNKQLEVLLDTNPERFDSYIFDSIKAADASYGIGLYGENRIIYRSSIYTAEAEERSIHLGIDLWVKAGTPILAPIAGTVHSFKDNVNPGDYGPTIILEHVSTDQKWYTLYGHLSRKSLKGLKIGQPVQEGQEIGRLGTYEENVFWPPHLHFQIIKDLEGNHGDYPGVCKPSEQDYYFNNCPDPNLLLKIPGI